MKRTFQSLYGRDCILRPFTKRLGIYVSGFCHASSIRVLQILLCLGAITAVAQTGQAQEAGFFVVPTVTIYAGDAIDQDMVDEREFAQVRPVRGGYITSIKSITGKVARRTLMPGAPIPQNAVENAKLVQKGTPTQLVFEDGGLRITTLVTPLQAGELNETIKARNIDSGLLVYGTVQQDGTLRATGGVQ